MAAPPTAALLSSIALDVKAVSRTSIASSAHPIATIPPPSWPARLPEKVLSWISTVTPHANWNWKVAPPPMK